MVYFYSPLMVVGAVWPCPHKYPWILPLVVVIDAVVLGILWKSRDDVGAMLILAATGAGLATWTLSHYLELGFVGGSLTFAGAMSPAVIFVIILAAMAGSADDPRFEDEY
jgi:hypothetical protein